MNKLKPLGALESLLLPLTMRRSNSEQREIFRRRKQLREQRLESRKAHRELAKQLRMESKLYEKLIIDAWTRLSYAWLSKLAGIETEGKAPRKRRVNKVKFSRIYMNAERIFFQIQVNQRRGVTSQNMLPYRVTVAHLTSDETVFELSHACNRMVTAQVEDYRKGAWIIVNRLEGFDGIPLHVSFRDVLPHMPAEVDRAPIVVGIGEHRKAHIVDLASHPHWLVGGSSGGGKSNMVNHIISTLMRFSDPTWLKFVLIDLKRMEFGYYEDSPHLYQPIIFDADQAIKTLSQLVAEVQNRATLMSNKAKELSEWNKRYPAKAMPRIVVIIDEFAELMLASGNEVSKEVERLVTRLTNLGRAVGIHVILATQRPAVKVLPNAIKINMPMIISARVPNYHQSTVILGSGEAANLPMLPGRMIYLSGSTIQTIQTPHVTDDDINESVRIARGRAAGLLRLDGIERIVVPEALIPYIVDHLEGSLSVEKLVRTFQRFAIPGKQLKDVLTEVIKKGRVQAGQREFVVEKRGNSWQLIEIISESIIEPAPEATQENKPQSEPLIYHDFIREPILMIPAHVGEVPQAQAAPEETIPRPRVERVVAPPPDSLTPDEMIDLFIKERCVVGRGVKGWASDLYESYSEFAALNDSSPLPKNVFGMKLTKRGFKGKASSSEGRVAARRWTGIALSKTDNIAV